MVKCKEILRKIFIMPLWLIIIMTIMSAAGLIWIFANHLDTKIYAYFVYVFSFYTLTLICVAGFFSLPGKYRHIKKKVYDNTYANRYLTDVIYKTRIKVNASLLINVLYVVINAVSAVFYETWWFAIFAAYYGIMALMHFLLVRYMDKNDIGEGALGEQKRARACAYILMTVNLVLSAVVLMMIYYDRGFEYTGYLIYVIALFTFYTITVAIVEVIRYRRYNSPVMSVSKSIKLASSLFSMLFLETAMFAQFGQETDDYVEKLMIMATGAVICVIVTVMSLYMIIRMNKEIRHLKEG